MSTVKKTTSPSGKDKAKGKSKPATYLAIGSTLFAAFSNIKKVRSARGEGDTLQLVDAVIRVAAVATGVALLVRELRQGHDDVLTD
ncbi:hypothetical protein [Streptomyces sp. HPF1205]|uniref:hypothetical protein n=1 Tax=Streptomyces sp. HPF1205 TaxID=2873262 RepID=UPI001CEC11C5|nr:hypothetical protein [Streptomyces sp. HPF1205]